MGRKGKQAKPKPKAKGPPRQMPPTERANQELTELATSRARQHYLSMGMAACDAERESWSPENHKRFIATWEIDAIFEQHGAVASRAKQVDAAVPRSSAKHAGDLAADAQQIPKGGEAAGSCQVRGTVDGRGLGTFATSHFDAGQLVFRDRCVLMGVVTPDREEIQDLSHLMMTDDPDEEAGYDNSDEEVDEEQLFWQLCDWQAERHGTGKTLRGVFVTNAYCIDPERDCTRELFPKLARVNHSCTPNVTVHDDGESFGSAVISLLALKPIAPGEELLVAYVSPLNPLQQRQEFLEANFGFTCRCTLCHRAASTCTSANANLESERATTFCIGDVVRLAGLVKQPALNGLQGCLIKWFSEKGRWQVQVDGQLECKLLQPGSLCFLRRAACDSNHPKEEFD